MRERRLKRHCFEGGGRDRQPKNAGKGRRTDCPLGPPEGMRSWGSIILTQGDPFWTSDL